MIATLRRRDAARIHLRAALAATLTALAVLAIVGPPDAEAAKRSVPFMRGFTVAEWGPTAYDTLDTPKLLKKLKNRGVDTVTFVVVWMQRNGRSNQVRSGSRTVPRKELIAAIKRARKMGFRVILRPYVDRDDYGWRGGITPSSPSAWWRSYRTFILKYADLAQKYKARGFVIGSEMQSMSGQATRWVSLAKAVRKEFKGFVTYQANHDESIRWWGSLDAISLSAYYPVATSATYTVDDLVAGWHSLDYLGVRRDWYSEVNALAAQYKLPVFFGEIGYRTIAESPMRPWDIELEGAESPESQMMAYEAAFRVWYQEPIFRGFMWWYLNPRKRLLDGKPGADHRPTTATLRTVGSWYKTQARRR